MSENLFLVPSYSRYRKILEKEKKKGKKKNNIINNQYTIAKSRTNNLPNYKNINIVFFSGLTIKQISNFISL